jgi:hypothetical protein
VLHPRVEFPSDRRFKAVATGRTQACALDDAGAPFCCGERFDDDPPAGPLSTLAVGTEFACGLEPGGALRCWGRKPPGGGAAIPGPFEQVAIAWRDLCAVRRGTGELECWRADGARMTRARDQWESFKRAPVVAGHPPCTLTVGGRVECDAGWPFGGAPRTHEL